MPLYNFIVYNICTTQKILNSNQINSLEIYYYPIVFVFIQLLYIDITSNIIILMIYTFIINYFMVIIY